jgi:transposase
MARKGKASGRKKRTALKPIRPMVAGIDIGGTEHWVCGPEQDDGERQVRVFGATTPELHKMADWLRGLGVESVAMESTYVYWIPVYEVLEEAGLEVILVNARTLKNVPGRKTDMHDCQWLQLLHSCGLLRGSFRPKEEVCRLRALQRQRSNLVDERARIVHWMQKSLDQMNVRVHRAVSDLTGVTGMKIIRAIVSGERDPMALAEFRDKRCKKSTQLIAEHLTGTWRAEHLFNLKSALELFDQVERSIQSYDDELQRVIEGLTPEDRRHDQVPEHPNPNKTRSMRRRGETELRKALCRFAGKDLTVIDGISAESARVILTEVGPDITAFPSEKHFISWLHLCPRTPISGGKPLKHKKNSLGASRVGATLRLAAVSLGRSPTALGATYRRIARRKSAAVAVFAVARKLAQLIYRLLRYGTEYVDIGATAYEQQFHQRRLAALARNAQEVGFKLVPIEGTTG